jgi:hypothetical protein
MDVPSLIYRDSLGRMKNVPLGPEDLRLKKMMVKKEKVFDGAKEKTCTLFFHKD